MSKYISLENLERYDAKMQERAASFCASKEDGMWRQTDKAGAVQFWPVGNSPLEGTVEFMFKETPPASGDKSPTNPSTISGVSSVKVTRCGKNLCPTTVTYRNYNDITVTANTDGSLTFNGTARAGTGFYAEVYHKFYPTVDHGLILKRGADYTVTMTGDSGISFNLYRTQRTTTDGGYGNPVINITTGETSTTTIPSTITGLIFRILVPAGATVSNATVKIQLEEGPTATAFEPYSGADYTLPLNGTYYGGSIDLATGLMTVTHRYMDISGDTANLITNVTYEGTDTSCCYFSPYPGRLMTKDTAVSNRFIINESATSFRNDLEMLYTANGATTVVFRINKSKLGSSYDATDAAAIKSAWVEWFSNNPTCIVYQLATPQTVQLTPTEILSLPQSDKYVPRLNTIYSDADAVQIVYQKNPVRDKFEKVQAIIAQGGNV